MAHAQYDKARKVRDRAFHVSQMADYLHRACAVDEDIEFERTSLLNMLGFESMLHDPSLIGAREENFTRWKTPISMPTVRRTGRITRLWLTWPQSWRPCVPKQAP